MHVVTISRAHLRAAIGVLIASVLLGVTLGAVADGRYREAKPPSPLPAGAPDDSFDRPDGVGLGITDDGRTWIESGAWRISDGTAIHAGDGDGWAVALVDLGETDGEVAAVARSVARPMGIVVRATDPKNFISVQPVAGRGVWEIVEVLDGKHRRLAVTELASSAPGTSVRVKARGHEVSVRVNGQLVATIEVAERPDATMGGIAVHANADGAAWDDFYANGKA